MRKPHSCGREAGGQSANTKRRKVSQLNDKVPQVSQERFQLQSFSCFLIQVSVPNKNICSGSYYSTGATKDEHFLECFMITGVLVRNSKF